MPTMSLSHNPGRLTAERPAIEKFGRVGWFAKGDVYLLAGVFGVVLVAQASGWTDPSSSSQEASPTGAIKEVAGSPGGAALLWVLAIGLFIYAAWRVVTALLPGSTDTMGWVMRIGYVVSAVIYASFAITALSVANSTTTNEDGNQRVADLTTRTMSNAAGRWLIGIVGAIAIDAGLYRIAKGVKVDVTDELDLGGMSPERSRWTKRLGAVGEVGRASPSP